MRNIITKLIGLTRPIRINVRGQVNEVCQCHWDKETLRCRPFSLAQESDPRVRAMPFSLSPLNCQPMLMIFTMCSNEDALMKAFVQIQEAALQRKPNHMMARQQVAVNQIGKYSFEDVKIIVLSRVSSCSRSQHGRRNLLNSFRLKCSSIGCFY